MCLCVCVCGRQEVWVIYRRPNLTLSAARWAVFAEIKHIFESDANCRGLKKREAEGESVQLQPVLLLAEEKILVPNTDKDIKCFCPQGGGRQIQPL